MDYIFIKSIFAAIIFIMAMVCGTLAINARRDRATESFLSYSESVAGGIFLGVGLLHILPDSLEKFRQAYPHSHFPWMLLLCSLSIVFLTLFEKRFPCIKQKNTETLFPFVIAIVLSVHALFAGLALGIDRHLYSFLLIFIAIIAHKGAAAFALGISMRTAAFDRHRMLMVMVWFSLMTPLGIFFGSSLSHFLNTQQALLGEACFDAIAAGTFIYIASAHKGLDAHHNSVGHIISYVIGLITMAVVAIWL